MNGGDNTMSGTSMATPMSREALPSAWVVAVGSGPCTGVKLPANIIQKLRKDAQLHATTANGFSGDPLHPLSSKYYGYLAWAGSY